MRKINRFGILGSPLWLLATLVIACNLGYVNSPIVQSARASTSPVPVFTNTVATAGEETTSLPSLSETFPPRSTFTAQPSQTIPIQPSEEPFNPLPEGSSQTGAITPLDVVWEMIGQVDRDRALADLNKITGVVPICTENGCNTIANRLTGSEGLQWAKDYIYAELVSLGYSVEFQNWSRSGQADQNLVARKPGLLSPGEEVYFVAHMDGVGSGGNEQFPAADDDGSGVVDNLEMARVLSSYTFNRTLVLLFTTGEEQGTLGVQSYIDQLTPQELGSIKYVVNVDMVGYDGNGDGVMELWHGGHTPSMALTQTMSDTIQAYQLDLSPGFVVGCG